MLEVEEAPREPVVLALRGVPVKVLEGAELFPAFCLQAQPHFPRLGVEREVERQQGRFLVKSLHGDEFVPLGGEDES